MSVCGDLKYSGKNHAHSNLYYTKRQVGLLIRAAVEDLQLQIDALQTQIDACCDGDPPDPAGNPISHWTLDGTLADGVGGYDLTGVGSWSFDVDQVLLHQYVNLTGGHLESNAAALGVTGDLTLVGWVQVTNFVANNHSYFAAKYEWGTNNRGYRFGVTEEQKLRFICSPDGGYIHAQHAHDGSTALSAGYWYHVAAVFDSTAQTMTIYLDGVQDGSVKNVNFSQIYVSTAPFMLGANMENGAVVQTLDGWLFDWRIYDRALAASEIATQAADHPPPAKF